MAVGNKIILAGPDDDEVAAGIYRFNGSLSFREQTVLWTPLAVLDHVAGLVISRSALLPEMLLL